MLVMGWSIGGLRSPTLVSAIGTPGVAHVVFMELSRPALDRLHRELLHVGGGTRAEARAPSAYEEACRPPGRVDTEALALLGTAFGLVVVRRLHHRENRLHVVAVCEWHRGVFGGPVERRRGTELSAVAAPDEQTTGQPCWGARVVAGVREDERDAVATGRAAAVVDRALQLVEAAPLRGGPRCSVAQVALAVGAPSGPGVDVGWGAGRGTGVAVVVTVVAA